MKKFAIHAALLIAVVAIAFATVTFDPSSGTGFVGKGDLQIPWGLNAQAMQTDANNVAFFYVDDTAYDVTCEFDTGSGNHVVHHVRNTPVHDSLAFDVSTATRKNPQGNLTGFNLTGAGTPTSTGPDVPSVGDSCPGGSTGGLITAVTPDAANTSQTLYATDGTNGPTAIWVNGASVN